MTKLLGQKGSEVVGGYSFDKPIVKLYSKGVLLGDFSSGTPPIVSPADNLVDAIAGIDESLRTPLMVVQFTDTEGATQQYQWFAQYYESFTYSDTNSWVKVKVVDDYKPYYFYNAPDLRTAEYGKTINTSGNIVDSSDPNSGVIRIVLDENPLKIATSWQSRFVSYDADGNRVRSTAAYSGFTLDPTTEAYADVAFTNGNISWKRGYKASTSSVPSAQQSQTVVLPNAVNFIAPDRYCYVSGKAPGTSTNVASYSEFIPLYKGEPIRSLSFDTNIMLTADNGVKAYFYDENETYLSSLSSLAGTVTPPESAKLVVVESLKYLDKVVCQSYVKYKEGSKSWLALGDSLTNIGNYVDLGYSAMVAETLGLRLMNRGVSGGTGLTIIEDVLPILDLNNYDIISVLIGTNDWAYNTTEIVFVERLNTILDTIATSTAKPVLCTLLSRADATPTTINAAGVTFARFSEIIRETATERSIPLLDMNAECQLNLNDPDMVTQYTANQAGEPDGLHPTDEGHRLFIAPLWEEFMKQQI